MPLLITSTPIALFFGPKTGNFLQDCVDFSLGIQDVGKMDSACGRVPFGAIRKEPKDRWGWLTHDFIVLSRHAPDPHNYGGVQQELRHKFDRRRRKFGYRFHPRPLPLIFKITGAEKPCRKCAWVLQNFGAAQAPYRETADPKFFTASGASRPGSGCGVHFQILRRRSKGRCTTGGQKGST